MRKFDPWPVLFKREWNRNWPFLVGFAITGTVITKYTLSLTDEFAYALRIAAESFCWLCEGWTLVCNIKTEAGLLEPV